jgi:hypothetical protein
MASSTVRHCQENPRPAASARTGQLACTGTTRQAPSARVVLHQGEHGARIVPVNVARASRDRKAFVGLRDEIWWNGRRLSETQGWDLRSVDDLSIGQLIAPKYTYDSGGRIKVEPKPETRARLGHSPDDADALLLAFYAPDEEPNFPFVYNIWWCLGCGRGFVWESGRRCLYCGEPAPLDDPYRGLR